MPGCRVGDIAFILPHSHIPPQSVGAFVKVVEQAPIIDGRLNNGVITGSGVTWVVVAKHDVLGYNVLDMQIVLKAGTRMYARDSSLQPIRPPAPPLEVPAPPVSKPVELTA